MGLELSRGRNLWVFVCLVVIHRCIHHICLPRTPPGHEQDSNQWLNRHFWKQGAQQVMADPWPRCKAGGQGPPLAILMAVVGHANTTQPDQLHLSVANKKVYAIKHDFPLYLLIEPLGTGQHPVWDKLVAIQAIFQHSCADYVWAVDSDSFIMNSSRSVMDVVLPNPMVHAHSAAACSTRTPDIIAAGACRTRINGGSIIWRNSDFTKKFLDDTWHSRFLAQPVAWKEQAAIWHMYKQRGNKQHVCIVKARTINAYPNQQDCHDGFGTYQDGDLIVHFPGGLKRHLADPNNKWLQAVRANLASFQHEQPQSSWAGRGQTLTITDAFGRQPTNQGCVFHVPMRSNMYAFSDMPTDFDVLIEPQAEGFTNLGWPMPAAQAPAASAGVKAVAGTETGETRQVAAAPQLDAARQMLPAWAMSDLGQAVGQLSAVNVSERNASAAWHDSLQ